MNRKAAFIFKDVAQGGDEWFNLRLGKATSSKFGAFMANYGAAFGPPAHKYALQLALERITGERSEFSFSNAHMDRGNIQEPDARELYEQTYFVDVENGGFFDCGEYSGSPDGLVNNDGVIEIKSVVAETHYKTLKRGSFDPAYKWQIAGHLDTTGRDWVDFVSYCSDFPEDRKLIVHRVTKGDFEKELEMLRSRRDEFLKLVRETRLVILNKDNN